MLKKISPFWVWICLVPSMAFSQSPEVWVQIEAHPSAIEAEQKARFYGATIANVSAFEVAGGWYAVTIGPLDQKDAESQLLKLRASGAIPLNSFIARGTNFQQKIWPLLSESNHSGNAAESDGTTLPAKQGAAQPTKSLIELSLQASETVEEARAIEATLKKDEKKQLQVALQWAGYYKSTIDGAFGPQTRDAMAAWQHDQGVKKTGVMTSEERGFLLAKYNEIIRPLRLEPISDLEAGITLKIPMSILAFERYNPPLVHFGSKTDTQHSVYMISQKGDQNSLQALYRALQSLDAIPQKGRREIKQNSFEINGKNNSLFSYASASLNDGQIKGFMLVWPADDTPRYERLLAEMKATFETFSGTLDPNIGADIIQSKDLLFGLKIKKPLFSRSGVFVSRKGHVITDALKLDKCDKITIENHYDAKIVATDPKSNLSIIASKENIAPVEFAEISLYKPIIGEKLIAAGYSYEGLLEAPSVIEAMVDDLQALDGSKDFLRLNIAMMAGDVGGPVLNKFGALNGILAADRNEDRSLPEKVHHAFKADNVVSLMNEVSQFVTYKNLIEPMSESLVARKARNITGLVSCWQN